MDKNFVARIRELVDKVGGQSALARRTGLSLGAVQRYLKGGEPSRTALIRLADAGSVSLNWLAYGYDNVGDQPKSLSIPLFGFGDSADQGWYSEVEYNINAALDWPDPDVFAIVAADHAMAREGIHPGHVCMVSPNTRCRKGDVMFIRRKDGMAALKVYDREDSEWCHLKGYIDPGDGGESVETTEQVKRSSIKQMGPVIFVKRRS
ncbi:MAG: XRE family transcriptional regulator [Alphaproteobacteria bacterium]|nr:XRE family transcriptional regulator [Alphaproteobacteria bacterium]